VARLRWLEPDTGPGRAGPARPDLQLYTRRSSAVGPSPDSRAMSQPRPGRPRPGRDAHGRHALFEKGRGGHRVAGTWGLAGSRRGREERGAMARGPTWEKKRSEASLDEQ
jgi:hypothetical protein